VSEFDEHGFLKEGTAVPTPPRIIHIPKFFEDCVSKDDAIRKMIAELNKPGHVESDGHDTLYRRLADALILILSIQGDYTP
jgi:hypothetical protein